MSDRPSNPHVDAIVPAAGSSQRMAGEDKLGARLGGRPLLAWTLANLATAPEIARIVLVVPPGRVAEIRAAPWLPAVVTDVVAGGTRRQESVAAGVAALLRRGADPDRVVLIHDGARPLVGPALVARVVAAAARDGAAIPAIPVADTLKRVRDGRIVETVDRLDLAAAQTPQGIRIGLLQEAYAALPPDGPATWTDEAALLEACTIPVHVVPGDPRNLKVTVPDDLDRARAALSMEGPQRVGFGHDSHSFGPGEPLRLGGIAFPGVPRLAGHSDGDVALHAVADALLGGAALGDLGRHFPAGPVTPAGVASTDLLVAVRGRVAEAGLRPVGLDLVIVGARPRLGVRLDDMRNAIAGLLGLPATSVSVKASSGNLVGAEGAGRAVSAHAIAALEPLT